MPYTLTLDGSDLHRYALAGTTACGWGPISSITGRPGRRVEWATRSEAEARAASSPVFYRGAVVREIAATDD